MCAVPCACIGSAVQTLVLQMETVMITQPLRRMTEVLVLETRLMNPLARNSTATLGTGLMPWATGTGFGTAASGYTASGYAALGSVAPGSTPWYRSFPIAARP